MKLKNNNNQKYNKKEKIWNNKFIKIFKGVIFSIINTFIILLIFAFILSNTNISENSIDIIIILTIIISIIWGSIITNYNIRKNGLINGLLVATIYLLIIYFISSILYSNFYITDKGFRIILISEISGMLGGIIGVNLKK